MNKKFQVFISSTFKDLIEERQVAVSTILDAGHIPAGMELFKAGNESQLKTVMKWIDNSDVYMLILGGRYGSIEPNSGNSYIEVEYRYAIEKGKPVFTFILEDSFLHLKASKLGKDVIFEKDCIEKYQSFKEFVMTKMIRKIEDIKDISINIYPTLNDIMNEYDLQGWIHGSSVEDNSNLLIENKELYKENAQLKNEISKLKKEFDVQNKKVYIGEFLFDDIKNTLFNKKFTVSKKIIEKEEDLKIDGLELFTIFYSIFCTGISNQYGMSEINKYLYFDVAPFYMGFNLLEKVKVTGVKWQRIQASKNGMKFYAMLEKEKHKAKNSN